MRLASHAHHHHDKKRTSAIWPSQRVSSNRRVIRCGGWEAVERGDFAMKIELGFLLVKQLGMRVIAPWARQAFPILQKALGVINGARQRRALIDDFLFRGYRTGSEPLRNGLDAPPSFGGIFPSPRAFRHSVL